MQTAKWRYFFAQILRLIHRRHEQPVNTGFLLVFPLLGNPLGSEGAFFMQITRKAYLEVWPSETVEGDEYISRHVSLLEAVESALNQPPGTYQIRVGSEVYYEVTLIARSITEFPDLDGDVDTVVPTPAPDVLWATVPDFLNQPQSSAFSEDVRAYMSGAGAATAVITIEDVSGDTASTLGLSIQNDDDLETAAGTVGSGVIRLVATYNSVAYRSNDIAFSVAAAAPPDILAPGQPMILSGSSASSTQNNLTIIPSWDPKSPSSDADGMASVRIHRRIGGGSYALLTTKAVSAGISPQLNALAIGTHTVSPTATQNANGLDWEITAEGAGNNSDELYFVHTAVVGDFYAYVAVSDYTATTGMIAAGQLAVRETASAGSKFIATGRIANASLSADAVFSEVKFRNTTGGGVQVDNPQTNLSGSPTFLIIRTGNVFNCWLWTGAVWILNRTETIVMNSSVLVGMFVRSGLVGTAVTIDFLNMNIHQGSLVTHADTGLTPETVYRYKCDAVDAA